MLLAQARQLGKGAVVSDSEGTRFTFIELDPQNDLIVECRAAMNGYIVLDRAACKVHVGSEYDCDRCGAYTPNGDGMYLEETIEGLGTDDRVCGECYDKHKEVRP